MNRIDWVILRRMMSRIGVTLAVFFGLICLVESLDSWRFSYLSGIGGPQLAILAIVTSAVQWTIKTLPVTVLIGAVLGLYDLQSRQELTVIKTTGMSIWRVLRAPTIALILASLAVSLVIEGVTTQINRGLTPSQPGDNSLLAQGGELWLEQGQPGQRYIISAQRILPGGQGLHDITIFMRDTPIGTRVVAPEAVLQDGAWHFATASRFHAEGPAEPLTNYSLPTTTTPADLALKLKSPEDMTFFELAEALSARMTDSGLRAAIAMRFMRLLTLPILLVGSLFIAFAFTAGYRRTSGYGVAVLYGIVLGFVVFVITEMADRAGSAGVLDPTLAAIGPGFVAIVIGLTVLLHKEDGRA
jgi:lipopolysaccharide export system permease protein